jgi:hypothetical protein
MNKVGSETCERAAAANHSYSLGNNPNSLSDTNGRSSLGLVAGGALPCVNLKKGGDMETAILYAAMTGVGVVAFYMGRIVGQSE